MVFMAAPLEWSHKESVCDRETIHPMTFTRWYSNYNTSGHNEIASESDEHCMWEGGRETKVNIRVLLPLSPQQALSN